MPLNKLRFFQNTLALSATTLIIVVWATVSYLAYQNNFLNKKINQVSNVKTENIKVDVETPLNWKTYSNSDLTFKYPANWILDNKDQTITSINSEILLSPSGKTMMAQCAHLEESRVVNKMLIQKFSRVTTNDEICGGPQNPIERMFWITKEGAENSFGPGLIFYYNSTQESESEKLFNQIFSTFKFLPDTTDWKFYRNQEMGFEFKYPSEFSVNQNDITSKPVVCKTNSSGSETEISVSEINIIMVPHSGNNYKDIWKDIFGFEFDTASYDGEATIGGKKAYFFYTGGEMPEGKQSFLVNLGNQKALEIIVKSPTIVYDCSESINKYEGYANQIISTFKFDRSCSSCPLYSPPAPGWCKDGTVIAGEKDECGCQQPPTCMTNN